MFQRVLHLRHTEKLSQRQIASIIGISRRRIKGMLDKSVLQGKPITRKSILDEYAHLVSHWYKQYPRLQAVQVYERLKSYGYQGSYPQVARLTRKFRQPKPVAYHSLTFLPGQESQIDWFYFNHKKLGQLYGFVYLLSYSRYAWGIFYPKTSFEFFLSGHLECFKHIGGLAHCHRYDNIKSVVIKRYPEIEYNAQFLDFANYYGFSIYLCNPYKANEKGRVERLIRDIRTFLYALEDIIDIDELNIKFHHWLTQRNDTIHRSTGKTPKELLGQERLVALPKNEYLPRRIIQALVSKTALVEFEMNKYSVPTVCAGKAVEIIALPEKIEIWIKGKRIAAHKRSFDKKQVIQNPLHSEKLLNHTSRFKMKRIFQLISNMDTVFNHFLTHQDNDNQRIIAAYQLFCMLKGHSKAVLISAVRELNMMKCFKIKALGSLLHLPQPKQGHPLWPQDTQLLNLTYQQRSLEDYDSNSADLEAA